MPKHTSDFTTENSIRMAALADEMANAALRAISEFVAKNPEVEKYDAPVLMGTVIGNIAARNNEEAFRNEFCPHCLADSFRYGMVTKRMEIEENAKKH
jgi:hypothetical protein